MTSSNASDISADGEATRAPQSSPEKATRATVAIERELCKGCGFCIEFCPMHALEFDTGFNAKGYHPPRLSHPEACVGCNLCGLYCPDFAIFGRAQPAGIPRAAADEAHTPPAAIDSSKESR